MLNIKAQLESDSSGRSLATLKKVLFDVQDMKRVADFFLKKLTQDAIFEYRKGAPVPKAAMSKNSYRTRFTQGSILEISARDETLLNMFSTKPKPPKPQPFRMDWLTKQSGVNVVPMRDKYGNVIFRSTPLMIRDAWIHPGITRHIYIQKTMDAVFDLMREIAFGKFVDLLKKSRIT